MVDTASINEVIHVGMIAPRALIDALEKGFAGSQIRISQFACDRRRIVMDLGDYDLIQVTAFYTTRYVFNRLIVFRLLGKPVVRYWVGNDVLWLQRSLRERYLARIADLGITGNIAKWCNLSKELKAVGIASRVIPGPHAISDAQPIGELPPGFNVLVYLPQSEWDLYHGNLILRLAAGHTQWQFLVVGHTGHDVEYLPNVEYLGYLGPEEMDAVYRRTSVLLRITRHDGLPRMIVEALARKLPVVWNQPFPYCSEAHSDEDIRRVLKCLAENPRLNSDGWEYISREFNPRELARRWYEFYSELL